MSYTVDELTSFDNIVNRGANPDREIGGDVLFYITTPKESIPYSRALGTVIKENRPLNLQRDVEISISIIESVQLYNDSISNKIVERRVSVDYNALEYDQSQVSIGDLAVKVPYVQLKDLNSKTIEIQ